ncbi:hypothetical protein C8Q72DRAFT_883377 [Fomitopsis betulina]|nr:hypothetical protein C8Q72DRAFT_883377 [Fomitopsis betulina]
MSVQDLPLEVWYKICCYACIDDGTTGLSLGQVSHYVRAASRLSHLHSVAIGGGYQLRKFADLLDALPDEHKRVQHLFIAKPYHILTKDPIMHPVEAPTSLIGWVELYENTVYGRLHPNSELRARRLLADVGWFGDAQAPPDFETIRVEGFWIALSRILKAAGPQLVTLTIDVGHIWPLFLSYNDFPCLEELTLIGAFVKANDFLRGMQEKARMLPPLRRLHLIGCWRYFPAFWRRAPALTHLRLSEVDPLVRLDNSLISTLLAMRRRGPTMPVGQAEAYDGLPNLQLFIIGLSARAEPQRKVYWERWVQPMDFILLPESALGDVYTVERAKKHWRERLAGGPGCWQLEERFSLTVNQGTFNPHMSMTD